MYQSSGWCKKLDQACMFLLCISALLCWCLIAVMVLCCACDWVHFTRTLFSHHDVSFSCSARVCLHVSTLYHIVCALLCRTYVRQHWKCNIVKYIIVFPLILQVFFLPLLFLSTNAERRYFFDFLWMFLLPVREQRWSTKRELMFLPCTTLLHLNLSALCVYVARQ